jgi:hypothetical protein
MQLYNARGGVVHGAFIMKISVENRHYTIHTLLVYLQRISLKKVFLAKLVMIRGIPIYIKLVQGGLKLIGAYQC